MKLSILAAAAVVIGVTSIAAVAPATNDHLPLVIKTPSIDHVGTVIGEGGYNLVYPIDHGTRAEQQAQIRARLQNMVSLLRSRDVSWMSADLRAERERNLERLLEYREIGRFPINFDHPEAQLPCFIDREGNICAVGYLVEKTAGRDVAEQINKEYQYLTVAQIDARTPVLAEWASTSGFTMAEIRTIQEPAMDQMPRQRRIPVIAERPDPVPSSLPTPANMPQPENPPTVEPAPAPTATPNPTPLENIFEDSGNSGPVIGMNDRSARSMPSARNLVRR